MREKPFVNYLSIGQKVRRKDMAINGLKPGQQMVVTLKSLRQLTNKDGVRVTRIEIEPLEIVQAEIVIDHFSPDTVNKGVMFAAPKKKKDE